MKRKRKKLTEKKEVRSRCKRCGRILKNPEAIKIGYGFVCFKKSSVVKLKSLFKERK